MRNMKEGETVVVVAVVVVVVVVGSHELQNRSKMTKMRNKNRKE